MRLIQWTEDGIFKITKYLTGKNVPKYAILSHTWLPDNDQEISFDDLIQQDGKYAEYKPESYAKIKLCCQQAAKDGLDHVWVDTCCIKRDSSQELEEAIRTMYAWYRKAARCYVILTDVRVNQVPGHGMKGLPERSWELDFRHSIWFTRGWTLQELLAPESVVFYSVEGIRLGDKKSLQAIIHGITGIPYEALRGEEVTSYSVDQRLLWAANRETKRIEDKAYCLLGIFNISMPILYGEGEGAFERLQEEINKKHAENARFNHLLSTLPVAYEAAFNSLRNKDEPICLLNTRAELLEDIGKWLYGLDERCMFWINGMPGTGKSTVARTVARTYSERRELGASFFFSRGDGDLGNANKFVATLAQQLATMIPSARRYICEAIVNQEDVMDRPVRDQWQKLIIDPLSRLDSDPFGTPVLLVIDALDECERELDVLAVIKALLTARSLSNIRLKILISTRSDTLACQTSKGISEVERRALILHRISPSLVDRDLSIFFETNFSVIREEVGFGDGWPGVGTMKRLVEVSRGLFISASTACRFIHGGRWLAKKRINLLIDGYQYGASPEQQLDQIYTNVLRDSIQEDHKEKDKETLYSMLRGILGTIVVLCSPLSMESLAKLLDIPLRDVKDTLANLDTVFKIPNKTSHPIRPRHVTLRDFLLDKERSSDLGFWVDEKKAHETLADKCLALMSKKLKKDICGLGWECTRVEDVDPDRIQRCIPLDLQYACLYWVEHYRQSGICLSDGDRVDHFFKKHFLHWLEAINLMGKSSEMGAIIRLYHSHLDPSNNTLQIPFMKDARRFVFLAQNIMKQQPLQIYGEALALIPSSNQLKEHFRSQTHPWINDIRMAESIAPIVKDEFNYVSDLAFTPDSKKIASGSNFEAVRFWDVATRTLLSKYGGSTDKMSSVAISPDGMTLAAGSDDSTVMAWDIETGELRYRIRAHSGWVNSVVFSPDGKILASGAMDETFALWDASTGREIKRFDNESSCVNTATFSPDGALIATGSIDHTVRLWDVLNDSGEIRLALHGHLGCINSVRFSPDGKRIISGSDDMTVKIWDTVLGTERMTLEGHTKKVMAVAFSLDARLVVSGSEDKTVRLWDAISGTLLGTLSDHTSGINSVQFSPNGKLLASSSFDDEVKLWDTKTWGLIGKLDDLEENLSPDVSSTQLSGDLASIGVMNNKQPKGGPSTMMSMACSLDGQWHASASPYATIKLWLKGKEHGELKGHSGRINHLSFSPDSLQIASASADKTVRLWNTRTGAACHTLEGHLGNVLLVLFSSNGRQVASCSTDETIRIWDPRTGIALGKLDGHSSIINDLAFSPDNRFIASCSSDKTVILWDLETCATFAKFRDHPNPVNLVRVFSKLSRRLICSTFDLGYLPDSRKKLCIRATL